MLDKMKALHGKLDSVAKALLEFAIEVPGKGYVLGGVVGLMTYGAIKLFS